MKNAAILFLSGLFLMGSGISISIGSIAPLLVIMGLGITIIGITSFVFNSAA